MFLNYEALKVSGTVNSPIGYTGSTIDTSMWGNVQLQVSSSAVALTGTFQVTDIEVRYGVPDPASWQTLLSLNVGANSVGSSSITPINSKWGRLLTSVTSGSSGSVDAHLSFSDRYTLVIDSAVTPAAVSGAISVAQLTASQIAAGQLTYARNSIPLIDTYTIAISNNTASINPMSGSSQFVLVTANTQLSTSFADVPASKSATTSVFVSASAVTMSFAGVDNWAGGNPSTVTAAGKYLYVLTNYLSSSTPIIVGSWQSLS